jgi:small multidrug resistance pump
MLSPFEDHAWPRAAPSQPCGWMRAVLWAAAIYNVAWGAFAILRPLTIFRWCGFDPLPVYPELWQCIGMIVGVYGVGYGIAATNPFRHWPIVLVGLMGKIFGPIGFVEAVTSGRFPLAMGLTIVTNDLIWWVPFGVILWKAFQSNRVHSESPPEQKPTEYCP